MQHPNYYYRNIVQVSTRLGNSTRIPEPRLNGKSAIDEIHQNTQNKTINRNYNENVLKGATNKEFNNYKTSLKDVDTVGIKRGDPNSRRHLTPKNPFPKSLRNNEFARNYVTELHRHSKRFSHRPIKKRLKNNDKLRKHKEIFGNYHKRTYFMFSGNDKKHVQSDNSTIVKSIKRESNGKGNMFMHFVLSTIRPRFKWLKTADVKKSTSAGIQQGNIMTGRPKAKELIDQQPLSYKRKEKLFRPLNDFNSHEKDINTIFDNESQDEKSKFDVQQLLAQGTFTSNKPMLHFLKHNISEQNKYIKGDKIKLETPNSNFDTWNKRILSKKDINDSLEIIQKIENILKIFQSYSDLRENSTINRLPRIISDSKVKNVSNNPNVSQVKKMNDWTSLSWKWILLIICLLLLKVFLTSFLCFCLCSKRRISQMSKNRNNSVFDYFEKNCNFGESDEDSDHVLFERTKRSSQSSST